MVSCLIHSYPYVIWMPHKWKSGIVGNGRNIRSLWSVYYVYSTFSSFAWLRCCWGDHLHRNPRAWVPTIWSYKITRISAHLLCHIWLFCRLYAAAKHLHEAKCSFFINAKNRNHLTPKWKVSTNVVAFFNKTVGIRMYELICISLPWQPQLLIEKHC